MTVNRVTFERLQSLASREDLRRVALARLVRDALGTGRPFPAGRGRPPRRGLSTDGLDPDEDASWRELHDLTREREGAAGGARAVSFSALEGGVCVRRDGRTPPEQEPVGDDDRRRRVRLADGQPGGHPAPCGRWRPPRRCRPARPTTGRVGRAGGGAPRPPDRGAPQGSGAAIMRVAGGPRNHLPRPARQVCHVAFVRPHALSVGVHPYLGQGGDPAPCSLAVCGFQRGIRVGVTAIHAGDRG